MVFALAVLTAGGSAAQAQGQLNLYCSVQVEWCNAVASEFQKATGITVNMQEESSQHKNRAKAWRILRSRVFELYENQRRAERDSQRRNMIGSGDRSEKIRTYNFPQNRVTDHRIGLSLYNLDKIIAGNMGELIAALREYDRQQRLKNLYLAPKTGVSTTK